MERIFAIGDIHGCLDKLVALIDALEVDFKRDLLVFMGDYIDRGPQSKEVVDYLLDLKGRAPRMVFLKGNHEEMFEGYLAGTSGFMFVSNGGDTTVESYMRHGGFGDLLLPPEHDRFFKSLLTHFETEEFFFVHAGLRPKVALKDQTARDMLWIREPFIDSKYDFGKRIIFAHTPFEKPLVMKNKIGIDTGAVYGNKLTCVELPALHFTSV